MSEEGNGNGNGNGPRIVGELVLTLDEMGTLGMGVNGELKTDDVLLMLAKAKLRVDSQIMGAMAVADARQAIEENKHKIQLPPSGFQPPHRRRF